jgi:hypothetical protein
MGFFLWFVETKKAVVKPADFGMEAVCPGGWDCIQVDADDSPSGGAGVLCRDARVSATEFSNARFCAVGPKWFEGDGVWCGVWSDWMPRLEACERDGDLVGFRRVMSSGEELVIPTVLTKSGRNNWPAWFATDEPELSGTLFSDVRRFAHWALANAGRPVNEQTEAPGRVDVAVELVALNYEVDELELEALGWDSRVAGEVMLIASGIIDNGLGSGLSDDGGDGDAA